MAFEGGVSQERGPASKDAEQKESQEQRRDALRERAKGAFTAEQYAALELLIERCFRVPQFGEYHTEGMYMDVHLEKMVAAVDALAEGQLIEGIPPAIYLDLKDIAREHGQELIQYVFLHDVAKADTLKLVKGAGKNAFETVSWDEWLDLLPESLRDTDDPAALRAFLEQQGYLQVSYPKHGSLGRELVQDVPGINPTVLTAIEKHEVGFQFGKVSAKLYRKHFGEMDQFARNMVMAAAFVDTMATVRATGEPDLHDFTRYIASRENDEYIDAIQEALDGLSDEEMANVDPQKINRELNNLIKSDRAFGEMPFAKVFTAFKKDVHRTVYNRSEIASKINALPFELTRQTQLALLDAISEDTGYLDTKRLNEVIDALVVEGTLQMKQKGKIYSIFR